MSAVCSRHGLVRFAATVADVQRSAAKPDVPRVSLRNFIEDVLGVSDECRLKGRLKESGAPEAAASVHKSLTENYSAALQKKLISPMSLLTYVLD